MGFEVHDLIIGRLGLPYLIGMVTVINIIIESACGLLIWIDDRNSPNLTTSQAQKNLKDVVTLNWEELYLIDFVVFVLEVAMLTESISADHLLLT